jgi:hypothetical protein
MLTNAQNVLLPLDEKRVSQNIKKLELTVMKDLSNVRNALMLLDKYMASQDINECRYINGDHL